MKLVPLITTIAALAMSSSSPRPASAMLASGSHSAARANPTLRTQGALSSRISHLKSGAVAPAGTRSVVTTLRKKVPNAAITTWVLKTSLPNSRYALGFVDQGGGTYLVAESDHLYPVTARTERAVEINKSAPNYFKQFAGYPAYFLEPEHLSKTGESTVPFIDTIYMATIVRGNARMFYIDHSRQTRQENITFYGYDLGAAHAGDPFADALYGKMVFADEPILTAQAAEAIRRSRSRPPASPTPTPTAAPSATATA